MCLGKCLQTVELIWRFICRQWEVTENEWRRYQTAQSKGRMSLSFIFYKVTSMNLFLRQSLRKQKQTNKHTKSHFEHYFQIGLSISACQQKHWKVRTVTFCFFAHCTEVSLSAPVVLGKFSTGSRRDISWLCFHQCDSVRFPPS